MRSWGKCSHYQQQCTQIRVTNTNKPAPVPVRMPGEKAASGARFPRRSRLLCVELGREFTSVLWSISLNIGWREIRTYFTMCWLVGERPATPAHVPEFPCGVHWICLSSLLGKSPPSMDDTSGAGVLVDGRLGRLDFEAVWLIAVKDGVA